MFRNGEAYPCPHDHYMTAAGMPEAETRPVCLLYCMAIQLGLQDNNTFTRKVAVSSPIEIIGYFQLA
jgi:hypothetical protein